MGRLMDWNDGAAGRAASELPLGEGELAPVFCLPDADMGLFDLGEVLQKHAVVLHFYPRNAMPSSRRQAIDFSEREREFARCGAVLVGISLDQCAAHAEFRDENGISMELLSDPDGEVCRLYRVWHDRMADGVTRPTVHRATFIIGRDGRLLHADYNVDLSEHTDEVLARLKSISGSQNGNHQEHRRHA